MREWSWRAAEAERAVHLDMLCQNQTGCLHRLKKASGNLGWCRRSARLQEKEPWQEEPSAAGPHRWGSSPLRWAARGRVGDTWVGAGQGQSGCSQDVDAQLWVGQLIPATASPRTTGRTTTEEADLSTMGLTQWCSQVSEMCRCLFQDVGVSSGEGKLPMVMRLPNVLFIWVFYSQEKLIRLRTTIL